MSSLFGTIQDLRAQRSEKLRELQLLDQAIKSLEQLVRKDTAAPTERPSPISRKKGPGTTEAILTILSEAGRPLQDREILRAMQARNWGPPSKTPLNALRASLSRLRRAEKIKRRERDGAYLIPKNTEASREQEASDRVSNQGGSMDPP